MDKLNEENETKDWAPGEWCEVCHNGGGVLYGCDRCPRIYHPKCYTPILLQEPPDDWICIMCTTIDETKKLSNNPKEGKYGSGQMGERELQICRRLLLAVFNRWPECCTFQSVKSLNFKAYRQIIDKPIALDVIKDRLNITSKDQYTCIRKFVDDMRLMFANCRKFWQSNKDGTVYIKHASSLEEFFDVQLTDWQQIVYLDSDCDDILSDACRSDNDNSQVSPKEPIVTVADSSKPVADNISLYDNIKMKSSSKDSKPNKIVKPGVKDVNWVKQVEIRPRKKQKHNYCETDEQDIQPKLLDKDEKEAKEAPSPNNRNKQRKRKSADKMIVEQQSKGKSSKSNNEKTINNGVSVKKVEDELKQLKSDSCLEGDEHSNSDEEDKKKKMLHEPPKEEELQQCKYCDAVYADINGLKGHTLKHFEDKIWSLLPKCRPFICPDKPFCSQEFKEKVTLMRHYAFEHYMYLKDLSTSIGKPLTKSRYTVLVNNSKIHQKVSSPCTNDQGKEYLDINCNDIGKPETKSAKVVLGLRPNIGVTKQIEKVVPQNSRNKRTCTVAEKNYEDLSEENIKDLQKVEGVEKDQILKFYQEIKESKIVSEEEEEEEYEEDNPNSEEDPPNEDRAEDIIKSEEDMAAHEIEEFSAFADLPLC